MLVDDDSNDDDDDDIDVCDEDDDGNVDRYLQCRWKVTTDNNRP